MKIKYQVGIVVEIPEPIRTKIHKMREELNTPTSKLPVEITIAGSYAVSYIPTGTELTIITEEVDKIASRFKPFSVTFDEINYFQNTSIVYLSPNKRTQFDDLHRAFKESGLNIKKLQFPYTPHCTLRAGEDLSKDDEEFESPGWHHDVLQDTEKRLKLGEEKTVDWDTAKKELRKRFE